MKCQCKTKSGKQCLRNAEPNAKCCWQHVQQAPQAPGPKIKSPKKQISAKKIKSQKMTASERKLQEKYCRCVMKVKSQGSTYNPWAVCTASVGRVNNSCKEFE